MHSPDGATSRRSSERSQNSLSVSGRQILSLRISCTYNMFRVAVHTVCCGASRVAYWYRSVSLSVCLSVSNDRVTSILYQDAFRVVNGLGQRNHGCHLSNTIERSAVAWIVAYYQWTKIKSLQNKILRDILLLSSSVSFFVKEWSFADFEQRITWQRFNL